MSLILGRAVPLRIGTPTTARGAPRTIFFSAFKSFFSFVLVFWVATEPAEFTTARATIDKPSLRFHEETESSSSDFSESSVLTEQPEATR